MARTRRGHAMLRALFLLALICAAHGGKKSEEKEKEKEKKKHKESSSYAPAEEKKDKESSSDAPAEEDGGAKGKKGKESSSDAPAEEGGGGGGGAKAAASGPGGSFDITKLGATGNGKTDSTKAVQDAWTSACGGTGKQTILIPTGDFLVGPLRLLGPCKGDVTIQVDGNLLATTDLSQYKGNWIEVKRVDNLVITGKGKLDGQGPAVWSKNSCSKKYDCKILPNSLVLEHVNNGQVSGITLLNSKFFHMNVFQCQDMVIKDVTVTAPGDSPNTDGIHMGDVAGVTIADTVIGVGDDCISIGPGSTKVNISGVTCGPGHGISIGSLGRYKDEKDVSDITVKDCTLKKTNNGLRIKAYDNSASVLSASNIHYENIKMEDSDNPIIIDMKYCPNKICVGSGASKVTVKDVTFKNVTGTSSCPEAVTLLCSDKDPCTGITMNNVDLKYSGTDNKTTAVCQNAKGTATGCFKELACF